MGRKPSESEKKKIAARRAKVAANIVAGVDYRTMSAALVQEGYSASLGTIASDAKWLLADWQKRSVEEMDNFVRVELRRLDIALNSIWDKVTDGNDRSIETMLKLMERRAKYLGLDAATTIEHGLPDDFKISGIKFSPRPAE